MQQSELLAKATHVTHTCFVIESSNISLIGMPGVGKSTVGILLAKALGWDFVDTDVMIQVAEERPLREIIRLEGIERFARIEQRYVVSLDRRRHVIAIGSTAICGPAAMQRVKALGLVIHLDLPLFALEDRFARHICNGQLMGPGQTLHGLYQQRQPLYQK